MEGCRKHRRETVRGNPRRQTVSNKGGKKGGRGKKNDEKKIKSDYLEKRWGLRKKLGFSILNSKKLSLLCLS